ncbi:MAG: hypothetical protein KF778_12245 [Rhodocyclaceae bacterium]|nr:hypothetical protein [Rhodocyclaceae bacterium]
MRLRSSLLGLILFACGTLARAEELVVVMAAGSGVEQLSREEVANIFLGRFRQLTDGRRALPIDNQSFKEEFYRKLVGRSPAEIGAYWAQLKFSGRTQPPEQEDESRALAIVVATPGAITYLERSKADSRVRVVLELGH